VAINPDLSKLRRLIAKLLCEQRPDRYVVSGSATGDLDIGDVQDTRWLDDIARQVAPMTPESLTQLLYARTLVGQEEGKATRLANGLLREYHRTSQLVLTWWDVKDHPVAVVNRLIVPGEPVKIIEERVALRACSSEDLRTFAREERRRASIDFSSRNDACLGAEETADEMDLAGAVLWLDWARRNGPMP
jgi:hypothetical protein